MTQLLPVLLAEIAQQGIKELGAVVNRHNHAARKVLANAGFAHLSAFDTKQDLYHWLLDKEASVIRQAG
jgi:L-amino acid N-acyltransferase YncA